MTARSVSASALMAMLGDNVELALVDVREELIFSRAHLLHARSIPLSRLELRFAAAVPRIETRIVLCDGANGLAARAATVLAAAGYRDVAILEGGVAAWEAAGYVLFSGVNVPSKAFGEFVEHEAGTPSVSAEELQRLIQDGADIVVLDSRPFDEYARVSIPTATSMPGAELALRARDAAPSPETTFIVNCAGRTRSIIGAQSLIDAGTPNKVFALRNGTMGWSLAGFDCDSGKSRRAPPPSGDALARAQQTAQRVAARYAIRHVDLATAQRWQADPARTTYLFDVRGPEDYAAGHVQGARSAPGGQLVQATDQYVGTLNASIVLVDELEVRATMTASWLTRMGWREVFVLVASGDETGAEPARVLGADVAGDDRAIEAGDLVRAIAQGDVTVIDLALSREYRRSHIPGAWFAIRSRLALAMPRIAASGTLVLTSEDGVLARLALDEAAALTAAPVAYLRGGNAAWCAAGQPVETGGGRMADEAVDIWLKAYEQPTDAAQAMADYLAWEVDLLPRIAKDGTCRFSV